MSITLIDNKSQSLKSTFRELRGYWDLLWMLAYRDIRVKYAQTLLGILWAILVPVITVLILYVVFVRIAKMENGKLPDILFILSGMVLWNYFSTMMNHSANVFLQAQDMVKKIYFPRILLPMSKGVSSMLELGILLVILIGFSLVCGIYPTWTWLLAPFFILAVVLIAFTIGTLLSALTIRFRDMHHVIPFIMQLGLFITPVAYPVSRIPESFQFLYYLNPMAIFIEGFRWSLFGTPYNFNAFYIALAITLIALYLVLLYFQKTIRLVADYV